MDTSVLDEELKKITEVNRALGEKSALLRLNSYSYFNGTITHNGKWYSPEKYIKEILDPIIEQFII